MIFQGEIQVRTSHRNELVEITAKVEALVRESGIQNGTVTLYVPHTTAAVTVNEHADPSVRQDIEETLSRLIPAGAHYRHLEGNADSHVKATLVGPSETLLIRNGRLLLGTWQGIFFCEFDGPRTRRVWVQIQGE